MSFSPGQLCEHLAALELKAGKPARYVIAFSGGLDSTTLAHALMAANTGVPVIAIHIDHGLHEDSARWDAQGAAFVKSLGIEYRSRRVAVPPDSGKGLEAAARDVRYAALQDELKPGDWLLSAHHRDDQAETLLINLVRGSGPAGIAGIGAIRRFGKGWLARPLLRVDRAALRSYAAEQALQWIDDPANADLRFDRNFLRHEILPRLQSRWPDIALRLQRSAGHASEAATLLDDLARLDLEALGGRPERLPIDEFLGLAAGRQRNLLRHALRELGLSTPSARQLERILNEVLRAREDAQPHVSWPGTSIRRYRNGLYLLPENLAETIKTAAIDGPRIALGAGLGVLYLDENAERGLSPGLVEQGLRLDFRKGGEEFRPDGQGHTRKLKKLLQEEGVVPWMRERVPLVYAGEQLVAVGDLWIAADAASSPGVGLRWDSRPVLH